MHQAADLFRPRHRLHIVSRREVRLEGADHDDVAEDEDGQDQSRDQAADQDVGDRQPRDAGEDDAEGARRDQDVQRAAGGDAAHR